MAFVDDLGLQLLLVGLVSLTIFYVTVRTYFRYRAGGNEAALNELKSGGPIVGIAGFIVLLYGLYGELTWPLFAGNTSPAAATLAGYNILFYDPTLLLGIILVSFVVTLALKLRTQYVGLFALMAGLIVIYYGVTGYNQGKTTEPLALLGLYTAFGASAIMSFPATFLIDKMLATRAAPSESSVKKEIGIPAGTLMVAAHAQQVAGRAKYRLGLTSNLSLLLFVVFLVGSAALAFYIGLNAIPAHLAKAP